MVVTQYPPAYEVGALRVAKLADQLPSFGWDPTVLTVSPRARTPARDPRTGRLLEPLEYEESSAVQRHEVWCINPFVLISFLRRATNGVRRLWGQKEPTGTDGVSSPSVRSSRAASFLYRFFVPDEYVLWFLPSLIRGIRIVRQERPAAVWTSYPTATGCLVATLISRIFRLPLVADFRDAWQELPGVSGGPIRSVLDQRLEARVLRTAKAVTAVSEGVLRQMHSLPDQMRTEIIPQGWDPSEWRRFGEAATRTSDEDGVFRMVYAGTIRQDVADPTPFLMSLRNAARDSSFDVARFRVSFVGHQSMNVEQIAADLGIREMVEARAHMTRSDILKLMAAADAVLLIRTKRGSEFITGKIWDYLTVRRPIFAVVDPSSAAAELIRDCEVGVAVDPADTEAITLALLRVWECFIRGDDLLSNLSISSLANLSTPLIAQRVARLLNAVST